MISCDICGSFRYEDTACPHCEPTIQTAQQALRRSAELAVVALTLASCTSTPLYGIQDSGRWETFDTAAATGDTGTEDTGTEDTGQ